MQRSEVGGQAVIEGVMIRSPQRISTAVRKQSGEIVIKNDDYISLTKRKKVFNLPIVRGIISLGEMLIIGIKTLNYSANVAMEDFEEEEKKKKGSSGVSSQEKKKTSNDLLLALTAIGAVALGLVVFFFLPLFLSKLMGVEKKALAFNLVAGIIRISLFIAYIWILSLVGEFRRVFQYHGAEHKSIFAYEAGENLCFETARKYPTAHPRCGTSFIIIVALFAILFYSLSDTVYYLVTGIPPTLLKRYLIHFILLPLVAGGAYELLKLSGKKRNSKIIRIFSAPGVWLQRITTREPTESQLEVAIAALENALGKSEELRVESKK
ncbi:MAG: DUF1385 domain-containing protein [Candidatus Zixiibacteriota bacterium]